MNYVPTWLEVFGSLTTVHMFSLFIKIGVSNLVGLSVGSIEVDQTEKVDAQYNHSFIAIYSNTLLLGGGRYQPADLGPCNHCSNHLRARLHLLSKVPLTIVDDLIIHKNSQLSSWPPWRKIRKTVYPPGWPQVDKGIFDLRQDTANPGDWRWTETHGF